MSSADARYLEVRLARAGLKRGGREVLRNISWTIRPGERWVLAGENGAGKTQLLKVVAGLVWPTPASPPPLFWRLGGEQGSSGYGFKEEIAYLGAERQDQYQRYGWNTRAERIVGTGLYRSDIPLDQLTAADRFQVRRILASLGGTELASRAFLTLSYGERRLVLLARALASRPRLLLLDEVLNGLDALNRQRILAWLAHCPRALPWVLATHRLEDLPKDATHALVLERGRVVYCGVRRGAPLSRWLGSGRTAAGGRARRPGAGRCLVRLDSASVYLEGRRVLSNLSFSVRAGQWWVVHGPNGSGKTTLLRTLYGDYGVAVGGCIERAGVRSGVPLEAFRRRVGLVAPHLQAEHPRRLTVQEVVQSGRHASIGLNEGPSAADRSAARRALAAFGLTRLARCTLAELSYGQSRRVLFARALVGAPQLLLLDEPFAGVDARTRRLLLERLRLAVGTAAVVVATHRGDEFSAWATHELELAYGRARYCGPAHRVGIPMVEAVG
jgi:molybdate transport system ATP-binding protein